MSNLNNYHNEINNANNFLNQIIYDIVQKSKATLDFLQCNNVTIEDTAHTEPIKTVDKTFTMSKDRKHQCNECKKSFYSRVQLVNHLKLHRDERPFPCELCSASFKFKAKLKSHMITHSTDKPWKCDQCETCFKHKENLDAHMPSHSGEKQFECEYCHTKFFQRASLKSHLNIHQKPNRFKCTFENCAKVFNFKHHLMSHIRTHTGWNFLLFYTI
jgi:uncharacterized Zn-finger protein